MTVAELIEFLKTQPQSMLVAYKLYSDACLLDKENIKIEEWCTPRNDGWLQGLRPDKPSQMYLVFPGN